MPSSSPKKKPKPSKRGAKRSITPPKTASYSRDQPIIIRATRQACDLSEKGRLAAYERYAYAWGWERGYKAAKRDLRK